MACVKVCQLVILYSGTILVDVNVETDTFGRQGIPYLKTSLHGVP